jgi:probable F420-dependent oxidoreductase
MKVRIGVGTGMGTPSGPDVGELARDLQELGFDSIWLPEILSSPAADPLAALAYAAACADRLKLGTTMVLPGRNPVRLAKQLATLDQLSGGRVLVTFVVGINRPAELDSLGVDRTRASAVDELLPLLRRLWTEDDVTHQGPRWTLRNVTVTPKPAQVPFEAWLGGSTPAALRRTGALSDGWLPSNCDPQEAARGRAAVEAAAADAGRSISPEHFGVSVGYAHEALPESVLGRMGTRTRPVDPAWVPIGLPRLRDLLAAYVDVGFSKFVVRPILPLTSWRAELEPLSDAVLDLQT